MKRLNFTSVATAIARDEPPPPQSRCRRPPRWPGYTAEDFERSPYNRRTQRATVLRLERAETELERVVAASAASMARERARAEREALQAQAPTPAILTPEELEQQRRTTPRPPARNVVTDEDLAAQIERTWANLGEPTPRAAYEISNIRRRGAR